MKTKILSIATIVSLSCLMEASAASVALGELSMDTAGQVLRPALRPVQMPGTVLKPQTHLKHRAAGHSAEAGKENVRHQENVPMATEEHEVKARKAAKADFTNQEEFFVFAKEAKGQYDSAVKLLRYMLSGSLDRVLTPDASSSSVYESCMRDAIVTVAATTRDRIAATFVQISKVTNGNSQAAKEILAKSGIHDMIFTLHHFHSKSKTFGFYAQKLEVAKEFDAYDAKRNESIGKIAQMDARRRAKLTKELRRIFKLANLTGSFEVF